ncbi:MAG: PqqD family protein, partial [Acidimicrobiia bacterium]|nr:PqqD family protein [Acidimicrobiia bacterium]
MSGAVLIDPVDRPGLLRLDGTAAALWAVLSGADGGIADHDLADALAREYAVAPDAIAGDIATAVQSLLDH